MFMFSYKCVCVIGISRQLWGVCPSLCPGSSKAKPSLGDSHDLFPAVKQNEWHGLVVWRCSGWFAIYLQEPEVKLLKPIQCAYELREN